MDGNKRSKYTYADVDVLKNKMNIKDNALLHEYERRIVSLKLLSIIDAKFSDKFDINHLNDIHKYLFDEVYDFAGKYREENLAKGDFRFAACEFIESELKKLLLKIEKDNFYIGVDKEKLAEALAYYLAEINVIHPYREGNGRTYREFLRQLAKKAGYILDWSSRPYDEILNASIKSIYDTSDLAKIIEQCLFEING